MMLSILLQSVLAGMCFVILYRCNERFQNLMFLLFGISSLAHALAQIGQDETLWSLWLEHYIVQCVILAKFWLSCFSGANWKATGRDRESGQEPISHGR